jgi:hypothetical protein
MVVKMSSCTDHSLAWMDVEGLLCDDEDDGRACFYMEFWKGTMCF